MPPPIPNRHRGHGRRKSIQGPATPANRIHVQPASPEVISSLISSLSIISSPANQLFENGGGLAPEKSPAPTTNTFGRLNGNDGRSSGGSFGIDYGAYDQPSLRELVQEESLEELAASPPVIRTAKPPSGFSPLTAPNSPRESSPLKTFLRGSSRPSSKGSTGSRDNDAASIGSVSIEPGQAPIQQLRRKSSGDSWGKKTRNQKGLMYMSSKERLREREHERKRTSGGTAPRDSSAEPLPLQRFDSNSFMAESAIGEEEEPSPTNAAHSTALPPGAVGGIGSGRFIPTRDSSLRKPPATKKRSSQRSSRPSGKERRSEDGVGPIHESTEHKQHRRERSKRDNSVAPSEGTSKMQEPLEYFDNSRPPRGSSLSNQQVAQNAVVEQVVVVNDYDDGAPSPTVGQGRSRQSSERPNKGSGRPSYERAESSAPKRSGSKTLKRLSAPLSPKPTDSGRNSNQMSRVASPEPNKPPQIHVDDRPSSADSIDDAVEAYLCSPRLSQKIKHPQTGRTISFSEVGDSEGYAVFCCVGMGLTRYITAFYDELALTLKLRLITPDRPGVGDSEPYTDGTATPLSWPGMLIHSPFYIPKLITFR
jgi:hypothetical protein